jgi:cytochrome c553
MRGRYQRKHSASHGTDFERRPMRIKSLFMLAGAVLGLVFSTGQAAGDPAKGTLKAKTCLGCHGVTGYRNAYPAYRVPKLGGQHPEYIVSALKDYASGARQHPTMQVQAESLSEQDMQDIAAFFAQSQQ